MAAKRTNNWSKYIAVFLIIAAVGALFYFLIQMTKPKAAPNNNTSTDSGILPSNGQKEDALDKVGDIIGGVGGVIDAIGDLGIFGKKNKNKTSPPISNGLI